VCAWLNACVGDDGVADQSTSPLAAHCRPHHIPELVSLQRSNRASSNVAPLKHAPPTNATLAFLRELTEESGDWEFYFQAKKQFHRKVRSGSITVRAPLSPWSLGIIPLIIRPTNECCCLQMACLIERYKSSAR
jgi:hypothetical protein